MTAASEPWNDSPKTSSAIAPARRNGTTDRIPHQIRIARRGRRYVGGVLRDSHSVCRLTPIVMVFSGDNALETSVAEQLNYENSRHKNNPFGVNYVKPKGSQIAREQLVNSGTFYLSS